MMFNLNVIYVNESMRGIPEDFNEAGKVLSCG